VVITPWDFWSVTRCSSWKKNEFGFSRTKPSYSPPMVVARNWLFRSGTSENKVCTRKGRRIILTLSLSLLVTLSLRVERSSSSNYHLLWKQLRTLWKGRILVTKKTDHSLLVGVRLRFRILKLEKKLNTPLKSSRTPFFCESNKLFHFGKKNSCHFMVIIHYFTVRTAQDGNGRWNAICERRPE